MLNPVLRTARYFFKSFRPKSYFVRYSPYKSSSSRKKNGIARVMKNNPNTINKTAKTNSCIYVVILGYPRIFFKHINRVHFKKSARMPL